MSDYPKRKTILCIDDDDGVLGYQRALLERSGYSVRHSHLPPARATNCGGLQDRRCDR